MYLRYRALGSATGTRYSAPEQVSLFGCRSGMIPHLLASGRAGQIPTAIEWAWHLPVQETLRATEQALVIDLKPKEREAGRFSLYEIRDVWGYSRDGWTPVMLRLRALSVDGDPALDDWREFTAGHDKWGPIYTFLFLRGGVQDGHLDGRWTTTSPSPTNSLLLFPYLMTHFTSIVRANDPSVLAAG